MVTVDRKRRTLGVATGPTVLLVTPNLDVGGAQEIVRTLARSLPEAGCPTVVCSFEDGLLRADIERTGVPLELLPPRRASALDPIAYLREMRSYRRALLEIVARHGVDVIQTKGLGTLDFLVMTLRRRSGPQVWWTIENAEFELRRDAVGGRPWLFGAKRAAHRALYRLGVELVDGVIAVSDDTASAFRAVAGRRGRVEVVCNGVDVERFPAAVDRRAMRASLSVGDDHHLMTMVGTFKRQKGQTYLIEALTQLAPEFPRLRLALAGDGVLREAVERQVSANGLDDRVSFLGTRRDVDAILAASDSFVLPSLWEGLPVALVEAMASGLPVVATEVSGSKQIVVDGVSGRLVPPGDPSALSEAIRSILVDEQGAAAMGRAGREHVVVSLGATEHARRLAGLFRGGSDGNEAPARVDGR
jgi:glycosyltransferase involved in cell wall biosynthesis